MSNNLMQAHRQWASRPADQRYTTLEALREAVNARRFASRSIDEDLGKIQITVNGEEIYVGGALSQSVPTHWAFQQFAGCLKAPAAYLRTLPAPLLTDCLNYGLERAQAAERQTLKFMTISQDEGPGVLQAVTSSTYGRIWDADVADAALRIVERSGGRFYNPKAYPVNQDGRVQIGVGEPVPSGLYASDRDIFIFMIDGGSMFDIGERAQLNRGFFLWNSEVGSKTFGMTTFLFNQVCGNHIVWGAQDINELVIRHTKNGPYRFDSEAAPALMNYVESSAKPMIDSIRKAMDYLLPADESGQKVSEETVFQFVNRYSKFTKSEVRNGIDAANREEGDCRTLWQVVQGLTAYARGFDWVDARADLERRAGKLLDLVK